MLIYLAQAPQKWIVSGLPGIRPESSASVFQVGQTWTDLLPLRLFRELGFCFKVGGLRGTHQ